MAKFWKNDPVDDFWKNDPVSEVPKPPSDRPVPVAGPLPGRAEPIVAPQKNVLAAPQVMTPEQAAITTPEEAYFQGLPEPPKEPFDWRKIPGVAFLSAAANLGGTSKEDQEGLQKSLDVLRQQEAEREKNKTTFSEVKEKKGFTAAAKEDFPGLLKELGHEFMQGIVPTAATMGAGSVGGPGGVAGGGLLAFGANAYANALINETRKFGGKLDDAKQFNETYLKNKEAIDKAAAGYGIAGGASGALFGLVPGGGGIKGFLGRIGFAYPGIAVGTEEARRMGMNEPMMSPEEVTETAVKSGLTAVPFEVAGALTPPRGPSAARPGRPPEGGAGPQGPTALPPFEPPMSPYRTETVYPAITAPGEGGPPTPPPSAVEARGKEPPPSPAAPPTGQPQTPPPAPPAAQAAKMVKEGSSPLEAIKAVGEEADVSLTKKTEPTPATAPIKEPIPVEKLADVLPRTADGKPDGFFLADAIQRITGSLQKWSELTPAQQHGVYDAIVSGTAKPEVTPTPASAPAPVKGGEKKPLPTMETAPEPFDLAIKGALSSAVASQQIDKEKKHFTEVEDRILGDGANEWRKLQKIVDSNPMTQEGIDRQNAAIKKIGEIENSLSKEEVDALYGVGMPNNLRDWGELSRQLQDVEGDRNEAMGAVIKAIGKLPFDKNLDQMGPYDKDRLAVIQHALNTEQKRGGDPKRFIAEALMQYATDLHRQGIEQADIDFMVGNLLNTMKNVMHFPKVEKKPATQIQNQPAEQPTTPTQTKPKPKQPKEKAPEKISSPVAYARKAGGINLESLAAFHDRKHFLKGAPGVIRKNGGVRAEDFANGMIMGTDMYPSFKAEIEANSQTAGKQAQATPEMVTQVLQDVATNTWSQIEKQARPTEAGEEEYYLEGVKPIHDAIKSIGITDGEVISEATKKMQMDSKLTPHEAVALAVADITKRNSDISDKELADFVGHDLWNAAQKGIKQLEEEEANQEFKRIQTLKKLGLTDKKVMDAALDMMAADPNLSAFEAASYALMDEARNIVPEAISKNEEKQILGAERKEPSEPTKHEAVGPEAGKPGAEREKPTETKKVEGAGPAKPERGPAPSKTETLTAEKPKVEVKLPEPPKPEQMPVVPEERLSIAEIQKMLDDNFIHGVEAIGSVPTSQHPADYKWAVKFPGDKTGSTATLSTVKKDVEDWIEGVLRVSPELKKPEIKKVTFVKPDVSKWFIDQNGGKPLYDDGKVALVRGNNPRNGTREFFVVTAKRGVPLEKYFGARRQGFEQLVLNYSAYYNSMASDKNPFASNVSGSKGIDKRLLATAAEWAKMLGIKTPLHLTTFEDANETEYYGPYEKIKVLAAPIETRAGGIINITDKDGSIILAAIGIKSKMPIEEQIETLAHEMGHVYEDFVWGNAPKDVKDAVIDDWKKWVKETKSGDFIAGLKKKSPMLHFEKTFASYGPTPSKGIDRSDLKYHLSFEEWFADNVARWAMTAARPLSVVERFFHDIAEKMRMLWQSARDKGFLPNENLKQFIEKSLYLHEADVEPSTKTETVREQKIINPNDFPEAERPMYEAPKDSLMAHLAYGLVDALNDLYKAEKAAEKVRGAPLPDNMSGYLANELFNPRVMDRQKKVWQNEIHPLLKAMKDDNISVEDMARFLYARHAPERNELMRSRDPSRFTEDNGSGMTNADAKAILDEFRARKPGQNAPSKYDLMDHIDRSYIRPIIERDLAQRLRSGLLTQEEFDSLKRTRPEGGYNHYVPLRGSAEAEAEAEPNNVRVGRNFKVAGPEYFKALGRESEAYNPLFNLIQQRMEGIVRQEKNRVDQALYNFVKSNPNPEFAEVLTEANAPVVKYLGADGMVKYRVGINPLQMDQYLPLKINGNQVYIKFNKDNPAAMRVIGVLRNQPANAVNPIIEGVGHLTRVFSKMNTTWVPNFFMTNFPRDAMDALLYLYGTKEGLASDFIPDLAKSISTIAGIHASDRIVPESERALYDEWLASGGKFDYGGFETIASVSEKIQKEVASYADGQPPLDVAKRLGEKSLENLGNYMGLLNEVFEQAVRFAAYRTARRNGFTKDRAASLSQNVTVNFPIKGQWVKGLNNFIPFLGARIGSMRAIYRLSKNPRFLAGVASFFAAQVLTSLLGVWMSDKDEFGKSRYYSDIPEWERAKNIILPIQNKDGGFYKMPLPFFVAPFMTLGDSVVGYMTGNMKADAAGAATMAAIADWANPLGSGSVWSSLQPGVFAPLLQLSVNRDWLNRPIHPEETSKTRGVPSFDQTKEKTPEWASNVSRVINDLTGGSDYKKGAVDIYPDTLNYLAKFFGGGVLSFIQSGKETIEKMGSGEPVKMEESPLTKRLVTRTTGVEEQKYFDSKRDIMEKENRFRAALEDLKDGSRSEEAKRVVKELGKELNISAGKNTGNVSTPELIRKIDKQNNELKEAIDLTRGNDRLSPLEQQSRIARYEKRIKDNMILVRKTIEKRTPAN